MFKGLFVIALKHYLPPRLAAAQNLQQTGHQLWEGFLEQHSRLGDWSSNTCGHGGGAGSVSLGRVAWQERWKVPVCWNEPLAASNKAGQVRTIWQLLESVLGCFLSP